MLAVWAQFLVEGLVNREVARNDRLGSASDTIALGVCLNESEDLSISEKIWVVVTLNDFMSGTS